MSFLYGTCQQRDIIHRRHGHQAIHCRCFKTWAYTSFTSTNNLVTQCAYCRANYTYPCFLCIEDITQNQQNPKQHVAIPPHVTNACKTSNTCSQCYLMISSWSVGIQVAVASGPTIRKLFQMLNNVLIEHLIYVKLIFPNSMASA